MKNCHLPKKSWNIQSRYESDRLSSHRLVAAYEKLVPKQRYVLKSSIRSNPIPHYEFSVIGGTDGTRSSSHLRARL